MGPTRSILTLKLPARFDLASAVCRYGYFLLAPNRWDPRTRRLHRPLQGHNDRIIHVTISHAPSSDRLRIVCDRRVRPDERPQIRRHVARMLRLDEDFAAWHKLHPAARRARFDRLFRSPTLFEDIVKTITGCNVTWPNTIRMNTLLCEKVGGGAFPTPKQLAAVRPGTLKARCKVGYRAERIVRLARQVVRGELDLDWFENPTHSTQAVYDRLRKIHGIGHYAAANLCQLLGRYDRIAIDTETYRHFRQVHQLSTPDDPRKLHPTIEAHFARYAPYQFLAYWFELWTGYEKRFNDARTWTATDPAMGITAANLK
ncbi:MAG: hypothetical protein V3U29_08200 [Phycisphaeraceae bacterium]